MQDFSEETHWEKAAKTRMGKYLTKIETDFILNAVNLAECTFVMDVGAEAGRFALLAAGSNTCVIGIDIDSYGLRRLKLKNKLVNVVQADVRKIPLRENMLDVVLMVEVLDYIPELETTLKECYRTLKPEGSLVLSFGNNSSLKSKLRKLRGKSYLHSYRKIIQGLDKLGFKTKKKVGYNWLPFNRTSESAFISLSAKTEKLFGLRSVPSLSPWVLIHTVKPR